jgi:hypothetical protein
MRWDLRGWRFPGSDHQASPSLVFVRYGNQS